MENDIHPERPRPVEPEAPKTRPPWLDPLLCIVLPALGANILFSALIGLRIIDTIWFGIFASGLAAWSLHLQPADPGPRTPDAENRLPILIALILALAGFALAWKIAIVFASVGIAASAFAVSSLFRGVEASRSRVWSFAILLFAFPWTDPAACLLGFSWRDFLSAAAAALARPLVGAVTVQGTTLGAESMKLALSSDVGGFWQAQFFLLCALGLAIGSDWKAPRVAAWLGIAALAAATAYLGFVASFFVVSVLAAGSLAPVWATALEISWWLAAFGMLAWLAWKMRSGEGARESAKKAAERRESMFPDDAGVKNLADGERVATARG